MTIPDRCLEKSATLRGPMPLFRLLLWLVDREDGVRGPPLDMSGRALVRAARRALGLC